MKNVTVSLPDEVYRNARIRAAEQNTSLSALVRRILLDLGSQESEFDRRKRLQDEILASVGTFRGSDRLTRDEVHGREVR